MRGLEIESALHDVQELNDGLFAGGFDVSKASYHAALLLSDRYGVLRSARRSDSGSARCWWRRRPARRRRRGRGCLPRRHHDRHPALPLPAPAPCTADQPVFSDIGPALHRGEADLGVLIHEGRLTYQRDGLRLVEDMGTSFERLAGAPIPLGGILAARALPDGVAETFSELLRESIAYGWANPDEVLMTIRRHAQELDEDVIWPYVELYVNDHTVDLGAEGRRSMEVLEQHGARRRRGAGGPPAAFSSWLTLNFTSSKLRFRCNRKRCRTTSSRSTYCRRVRARRLPPSCRNGCPSHPPRPRPWSRSWPRWAWSSISATTAPS